MRFWHFCPPYIDSSNTHAQLSSEARCLIFLSDPSYTSIVECAGSPEPSVVVP